MSTKCSGHTEYVPSPCPHPRIRPEGAAYAERNRGNMERWFDYSSNVDNYNSPRPGEKLCTDTARQIAKNNVGVMEEMMAGYPDVPVKFSIHPRAVKPEALENAESNNGSGVKNLIENYGQLSLDNEHPLPKVKGEEAKEYSERNHGRMDHIINNYGISTPDVQPSHKVSSGGYVNLEKAQGAEMGLILRMDGEKSPREVKQGILHQVSQGRGWDELPPASRMRPEGEGFAAKNANDSMFDIMRSDNIESVVLKEARVRTQIQESVSHRHSATKASRMRHEAMTNYNNANNHSEMAAILRGESEVRLTNPSRNIRHLQRSELW